MNYSHDDEDVANLQEWSMAEKVECKYFTRSAVPASATARDPFSCSATAAQRYADSYFAQSSTQSCVLVSW
ncbi:MAG: hypothetical protein A2494_03375 [Candidatus Lloydbacteria bacterium RIFOXYC12_FULL_46_25]|uniref:Uncharacterized protein n=1 Tax=Candidatus Lloydbacteria bacterium RIFOXYC12_FULL_46_25 TaxID=1798670 RepID=A0A1G2DXL0_9BACT|nr:MAG: hypothetical protein A2494_03375 [Candidatus Lloydbacteria bacterium RIFOXYC12_FULL_46_25]